MNISIRKKGIINNYLIIVTSRDIKIIKDISVKTDKNPWYEADFVIAPNDERIVKRNGPFEKRNEKENETWI